MPILHARIVLPVGAPPLENGAVVVEAGRITAVGRRGDFSGAPVWDLGDVVLMPGLINAHCHLDYTVMRGAILPQSSFANWIRRINDLKRTLTDDDYQHSIAAGFAELRRWGTTGVFNIEAFPEVMVRMPRPPLRTWWFYELLDIRHRVHTEDVVAGALTFFDRRPDWLGGFGLSPHAPYSTSAELYELTTSCAEKHGMPWTTHLAETAEEMEMFAGASGEMFDFLKPLGRPMGDTGGTTPVRRILGRGLVPRGGLLVHMNCLSAEDWNIVADRAGTFSVVHCPNCHAYFDRPPFELERFRALGVPVCLGTDSLASNGSLNLFSEMRTVRQRHPTLTAAEVLDMVTRIPARAIGFPGLLGEIAAGAHADLIAVPYAGSLGGVEEAIPDNRSEIEWMMVAGRVVPPADARPSGGRVGP